MAQERRLRVAVDPLEGLRARPRLFAALERAYPVSFVGDGGGCDGALIWVGGAAAPNGRPDAPTLEFVGGEARGRAPATVQLTRDPAVDSRLRGRRLVDAGAAGRSEVAAEPGDRILALADGRPAWVRKGAAQGIDRYVTTASPSELAGQASLRESFQEGAFFDLLPLLEFMRTLTAGLAWEPPPLRAALVIDDPNLHWTSYGYIGFGQLIAHAQRHAYHATLAMVPLDTWFFDRRAAALFHGSKPHISLAIHGNDHVRRELARPTRREDATRIAVQALSRIERFERRSGLSVARVMVPPHGRCSRLMMQALVEVGFEAACFEAGAREAVDRALAGWFPATVIERLPVISRRIVTGSLEDLVFQAYLNQPLVVYGHHEDFSDGLGRLEEAVDFLRGLGNVSWLSLGDVVASNYETRREASVLRLRLFTRRARVPVPEGVETIAVDSLGSGGEVGAVSVASGPAPATVSAGSDIAVAGGSAVEVQVDPPVRSLPRVDGAGWQPWPLARRLLVEGRDRLRPLVRGGVELGGVCRWRGSR